MSNGSKPTCGSQGATTDDVLKVFLFLLGAGSTGVSIVMGAKSILEVTAGVSVVGITAAGAIWIAAVLGAVLMLGLVFSFWWNRCLSSPDRLEACSAGVVNAAVPSFASASDVIFPFTAMHDRLDVVLKSVYWPLVTGGGAGWVFCAADSRSSPVIRCYYKDSEVCAAGGGAVVGGAVGAVGGILLAAAAVAAIGCATIIACVFALILAFIIAAVAVLVGAILGGWIGWGVAASSTPSTAEGNAIVVGDYVTTKGGIVTLGDANKARVYWFVDETTQHGRSTGSAEFSFTDPDTNLTTDACPAPIE